MIPGPHCYREKDQVLKAFWAAVRDESTTVVVPATVVAETWHGSPRNAKTATFMRSIDDCIVLTLASARETGELLARSKQGTMVDANVVSIAIAMRPSTIVTSDPNDIERLLQDAHVFYARENPSEPKVDVTIISV